MDAAETREHEERVARALTAIAEGKLSIAMQTLGAVYTRVREPAIRAALIALGDALDKVSRPPKKNLNQAQWLERDARGLPSDTAILTKMLRKGVGRKKLSVRSERLCLRAACPRAFDRAYKGLLSERAQPKDAKFIEAVLVHHVDPISFAAMTRRPAHWEKRMARIEAAANAFPTGPITRSGELARAVAAAVRDIDVAVALTIEEQEEDTLLVSLFAPVATNEPGARLVFADHIAARDPDWSEYIQLAVARETRELNKDEAARWKALSRIEHRFLGPLAASVSKTGLVMRGGFLSVGNLISASEDDARALTEHPAFATAEALFCKHVLGYAGAGVRALRGAGTRYVWSASKERFVRNTGGEPLDPRQLRDLTAMQTSLPFETIQVYANGREEMLVEGLRNLGAPNLKTLLLSGVPGASFDAIPPVPHLCFFYSPSSEAILTLFKRGELESLTALAAWTLTRSKSGAFDARFFRDPASRYSGLSRSEAQTRAEWFASELGASVRFEGDAN